MKRIEVLFSPAEFERLPNRDLSDTTCVVFDILRATSSIITALANGASSIRPVATIEEALQMHAENPEFLLAGERHGFRIDAKLTGGIDFHFGNSPREFAPGKVAGRTIAMTTTNGTRALRACLHSRKVLVGSFLNLAAIARWLNAQTPNELLLICSGTNEEASTEDTLAAGALADRLWNLLDNGHIADSAQIARSFYKSVQADLPGAMQLAHNGRRLLKIPDLAPDIPYCLKLDAIDLLAGLTAQGECVRLD